MSKSESSEDEDEDEELTEEEKGEAVGNFFKTLFVLSNTEMLDTYQRYAYLLKYAEYMKLNNLCSFDI